jgi:hypothetical protein
MIDLNDGQINNNGQIVPLLTNTERQMIDEYTSQVCPDLQYAKYIHGLTFHLNMS